MHCYAQQCSEKVHFEVSYYCMTGNTYYVYSCKRHTSIGGYLIASHGEHSHQLYGYTWRRTAPIIDEIPV